MKVLSGSILTGLSLLAEVLNEWFSHFFFSAYQIAQGVMLQGGGSFSHPPQFTVGGIPGVGVNIFIVTRILIWVFIVLGVVLIIWGLREKNSSIKERIAYDAVLGTLERRIETEVDWSKFAALEVLGLDEIALKKGQRDYVTIVTARLQGARIVLLGVLPERQKDVVVAFLRSIPQRLSETIRTVCCDMYEGYSEAVREELPQAEIVVDRFHVTRHYHRAADQLRQSELKRLKKELPAAAYQALKGHMWAFSKKPDELTTKEISNGTYPSN